MQYTCKYTDSFTWKQFHIHSATYVNLTFPVITDIKVYRWSEHQFPHIPHPCSRSGVTKWCITWDTDYLFRSDIGPHFKHFFQLFAPTKRTSWMYQNTIKQTVNLHISKPCWCPQYVKACIKSNMDWQSTVIFACRYITWKYVRAVRTPTFEFPLKHRLLADYVRFLFLEYLLYTFYMQQINN
jgi:hypothetical protein